MTIGGRLFSIGAVLPDLRVGHERMFRIAACVRVVVGVVLSTVFLVVYDGEPRWLVVLGTVLLGYATVAVTWMFVRRYGLVPPGRLAADLLVLFGVGLLAPQLRLPCALAILACLGFIAVTCRIATTIAAGLVPTVGYLVLSVVTSDLTWVSVGLAIPVVALCVALPARAIWNQARAIEEANLAISRELGLVLWQATGEGVTPTHLYGDTMALHGFSREFFMSDNGFESLLHPEDQAIDMEMNERIANGQSYRNRYRLRCADGTYKWIEEIAHVVLDDNGKRLCVQGLTLDVTEQVRSGEALSQLDGVVNSLSSGVVVMHLLDRSDPLSLTTISRNNAAVRQGISEWTVGSPVRLKPEWRRLSGKLAPPIANAILSGEPTVIHDVHFRNALDGREYRLAFQVTPLSDDRAAVIIDDLTELYAVQSALVTKLHTDDLTGLVNRTGLREAMNSAPLGSVVAMLDLDLFKEVNDAFGHDCGDLLLVKVAEVLRTAAPHVLVARLGGDEFGFLIPPEVAETFDVGPWVGHVLSMPLPLSNGLTLRTVGSVGVAAKDRVDLTADELLRRADVAMYIAKRHRTGFERYSAANDTAAPRKMTLLGELTRAVQSGELILHYQPIIDSRTGSIARVEGLMRWQHPTLGLLPPAEFIELTELNNLNADVVLHTLAMAIADALRWRTRGYDVPVSINIAGTTLHDASLIERMIASLGDAHLPRHLIGLELTERQLLLGSGASVDSLRRLAAAGFWLSVDDFGTGTSSLSALRHIPANELKIDKSFVDDLRSGDSPLIRSIVSLAHDLNLLVVAEGVEDQATFNWLSANGADQAQGYFFARPAPAAMLDLRLAHAVSAEPMLSNGAPVLKLDRQRQRRQAR